MGGDFSWEIVMEATKKDEGGGAGGKEREGRRGAEEREKTYNSYVVS
jgi:hypothetical protein